MLMRMKGNTVSTRLLIAFAVLGFLYAANIFLLSQLNRALVHRLPELSFVVVTSPEGVCDECFDAQRIPERVKALGVARADRIRTLSADSLWGKYMLWRYDLAELPAVVVSGDVSDVQLGELWRALGARAQGKTMILSGFLPSYNMDTGEKRGIVSLTLLTDKRCEKCSNPEFFVSLLQRSGVYVDSYNIYDVSSKDGSAYVKKYGITRVPTFIASPDIAAYSMIAGSWSDVGTVESDGSFVFRKTDVIRDSVFTNI